MGSSRNRNREVWGQLTREFFASGTDTDLRNVGKVIVMSWSFWAQLTRRVVRLLESHQENLVFLRLAEDDFLRNDALRFSNAVLAPDDCAEPLDYFFKGLDSQLTSLTVGCNGILECWGLRLDAGDPDIKPFIEMLDKLIELRVSLECGFEAIEDPIPDVSGDR